MKKNLRSYNFAKVFLASCMISTLALSGCSVSPDAVYSVNKSDLSIQLQSGNPGEEDFVAWDKIVKILPNDGLRQHVSEYHVFSDGDADALAYVETVTDNAKKWIFAVDYEDSSNPDPEYADDFIATIIHEYSHILSLNVDQVKREFSSCQTYKITEGCNKADSFLNKFYYSFWNTATKKEYLAELQDLSEGSKQDVIAEFYHSNKDSFVNEYSATNPAEDFAESFAFFVLSDKVNNPTIVKDKKLNFFYQFPELTAIRSHIRSKTTVRKS